MVELIEDREEVRKITETEDDAIIVASYGTFSTGINIKNLHNVIFASPSKSRIRNLQSIGRVLRKGNNKVKAKLFDIVLMTALKGYKKITLSTISLKESKFMSLKSSIMTSQLLT